MRCACGRPATTRCSYETEPGQRCDVPVCDACATSAGQNRYYCRPHYEAAQRPIEKAIPIGLWRAQQDGESRLTKLSDQDDVDEKKPRRYTAGRMVKITRGHELFREFFQASTVSIEMLANEAGVSTQALEAILKGSSKPVTKTQTLIEDTTGGVVPMSAWHKDAENPDGFVRETPTPNSRAVTNLRERAWQLYVSMAVNDPSIDPKMAVRMTMQFLIAVDRELLDERIEQLRGHNAKG